MVFVGGETMSALFCSRECRNMVVFVSCFIFFVFGALLSFWDLMFLL